MLVMMNSKRSVSVLCRFLPPRCTSTQQPLVICAPSRHRFVSCRAFSSNSLFPKQRALSIATREKSPLLFRHRSYSTSSSSSSAPSPPLLCVTPPQIPIWRKVWNDCRSNPWQLAGHMGFILALSSFMVTDMLWLRTLSICASISGLTYNFMAHARPLWLPICWGFIFVSVNGTQIIRMLLERKGVQFAEDEAELYDSLFRTVLTTHEFKKLMTIAHWEVIEGDSVLVEQGKVPTHLYLITSGLCAIEEEPNEASQGSLHFVGYLKSGQLVGEMRGDEGHNHKTQEGPKYAKSSIKTVSSCRCIVWDKAELQKLLRDNPSLKIGWNSFLSQDLFGKLEAHKEASKEQQYKLFLYGILVDGKVGDPERQAVQQYRAQYNISPELHRSVLGLFGWTEEDFQLGYQKGKQGDYWAWPNWAVRWGMNTQKPFIPPLSDITRPMCPPATAFSPSSSSVLAPSSSSSTSSSSSSLSSAFLSSLKGEGTESETHASASPSIPTAASVASEQEKAVVVTAAAAAERKEIHTGSANSEAKQQLHS